MRCRRLRGRRPASRDVARSSCGSCFRSASPLLAAKRVRCWPLQPRKILHGCYHYGCVLLTRSLFSLPVSSLCPLSVCLSPLTVFLSSCMRTTMNDSLAGGRVLQCLDPVATAAVVWLLSPSAEHRPPRRDVVVAAVLLSSMLLFASPAFDSHNVRRRSVVASACVCSRVCPCMCMYACAHHLL